VQDDHEGPRTVAGLSVFEHMPRAAECRVSLSPPGGFRFVRRLTICLRIAAYEYGASPLHAEIMQKRSIDNQTFYKVKLIFPRGDAASLLFGFDVEGKITGVAIMSMAGD
jgi:hypothetical protein